MHQQDPGEIWACAQPPDPEPAQQPTKYRTTHPPRWVCGNSCTTHPLWQVCGNTWSLPSVTTHPSLECLPPAMMINEHMYHTPTEAAPQALSACPLNMTIGEIAYHTPAVVGVWFYIMLATNEDP
ncbi:hypothetical protein BS47DRAFT_1363920 [Hydnum rufescens UP504]|uniref:Uncharacterized protein n=1 Tax=Hydnum rufescens UP504 TaxID=1448309 RepID=A0A9P6ASX8_9AGAM|nr:hypothetical protein BS47DRAFT_1363920 [Hydnum rufescens UP504]